MSLRTKLSLMLSAFLVLIAILAGGTIVIFDRMSETLASLGSVSSENKLYNELDRNIRELLEATKKWGASGDQRFKKQAHKAIADAEMSFGSLQRVVGRREDIDLLRTEYQQILESATTVLETRQPGGDPAVLSGIQKMESFGVNIIGHIDEFQEHSVNAVLNVVSAGKELKQELIYYHIVLITFSALVSVLLIIRIRAAISGPFGELLRATERVSRGDLSSRINSSRTDELGSVLSGFDAMVEALESSSRRDSVKLAETELFLDIAKIAGTTLELKDAMVLIAETIAFKLHYDSCVIYMLHPEINAFCLGAASRIDTDQKQGCLSLDAGIAGEIVSTLRPVIVDDTSLRDVSGLDMDGRYRSLFAGPIIRDNVCQGVLVIRNAGLYRFAEDEVNALRILAHTVGSVIRNAELYQATKKQLQKLTVLYELSRAVTSILNLDALLKMVAEEIARLLSSRGCIIRLLENNRLKVKFYYGLPHGLEEGMELAIGEGIAGWVAERGTPLLVEDLSKMPADMRLPTIEAKSVICVPLKVGDAVIGTLALYDKNGPDGGLVPFTVDDLNTAEGFASVSSIAIDKSNIYENEVRREKEASEARKRLAILFDSVQGGIITLNREFTIISANKYVEEWVGLSSAALIGKSSLDVFHDKIGICPHCAAKATFETGEINSIMQSRGVNYAELTAYPIKNEGGDIESCVVFIQDITERVLYQEETLSLYREVIQTKEYLESIIDNSADAIVTTDLEGVITSWNQGAEKTFGFAEAEALGQFLPFAPDFLLDKERENIERIKRGEVMKNIETLRKRRDGAIIEVSLSLSPIKDAAGEVIGISGISRDISEKKSVEKELIRRSQELSRLFFISSAMRGTLELDKLLRMVLVAVTMSDGMGFNRAILFLVDEEKRMVRGAMGVGPASPEEAWRVWDELSLQRKTLEDIMQEVIANPVAKDTFFDRLSMGIELSLDQDTILTRAVKEKRPFNVTSVKDEPLSDALLIQQLGTQAYAIVPLISRDKVIGIIWVDNYFNRKQISDEDMKFLASFSNHVASAIENARLFEKVKMAEQQLENIFESISDMVYFNSKDYEIMSINKAVSNKLGLPPSQIVGRKCYEVFHGTNEPYTKCPHHKTVNTRKAYVEELDDPHMGGTFLTSSSPIFDLNGEFMGSVHVVRDITEMKNLQQKLVMTEKMAALGEVAAKVAHEIRNPLVSVGGFAKRLEKKLDGNLQEYAGIIVKEVERLEGILREILGFVKEVRLAREMVDLNSLLDDVIILMHSGMDEKRILVAKDYRLHADVFVDPNRVKEAFVNIISNAIQSIAGSGTISVSTYASGAFAVVEVSDTGRGIPETDRQFIFNPFFTTKASGTGLGLAITRRIIQEHNGAIEVESEVDRGSLFRVHIPLKEVQ